MEVFQLWPTMLKEYLLFYALFVIVEYVTVQWRIHLEETGGNWREKCLS